MRVIVAGSRTIKNFKHVERAILAAKYQGFEITTLISGGAPGVDFLGEIWASKNGVTVEVYKAEWNKYGKAAGPMRNIDMAKVAEALILVWDGKSKGSANMKTVAEMRGLPIYEVII